MMRKLLSYYQKELETLREHGKTFSQLFPKVARRLGFSEGRTEDPHIERLIESFALLTAQIHQRLDDDMQQVTLGLMQTLAPQLCRTFPSVCIVELQPQRKASGMTAVKKLAAGLQITSHPIDGQSCQFETIYPITLWPADLTEALLELDENGTWWGLSLHFSVWPGATVSDDKLRLHLHGSVNQVNTFYTLICSELRQLTLIQHDQHITLPTNQVREVGFGADEALFNRDSRIAATHCLLHDYLVFPAKFHFIDLPLPDGFTATAETPFSLHMQFNRCTLTQKLDEFCMSIRQDFFRLNCSPAINLYSRRAEPINLHPHIAEYPVIANVREQEAISIWSIDRVHIQRTLNHQTTSFPVYALLGLDRGKADSQNGLFWQQLQHDVGGNEALTQSCHIAFADRRTNTLLPLGDVALLEITCHNGSRPAQMLNGDPLGDFTAELPLAGIKINALTRPTDPLAPPTNSNLRWRLLSQLTLNHMTLSGPHGCKVLKETLALYDFTNNRTMEQLVNHIYAMEVKAVNTRLVASDPHSLARGIEIEITFSADAIVEHEYFLFCRFLDHFLGLYAPVNSFSRLVTKVNHEKSIRYVWPVRAGRLSWI